MWNVRLLLNWSNWLEVEAKLSISSQIEKLPLGGMLWRMCLLYVSRTINLYLSSPGDAATPLDLVRDEIVGRPRTLPFGCLCVCQVAGPRLTKKFRGRKLIRCVYLAPKEPRGGGVFAVPVGSNELELFPSSRPVVEHDKLCYAVDDLKRLSNCDLTIQDSDDPERPINFEPEPRVPEGDVGPVGDDIAVESEGEDPELIPDKGSDPMELIIPEGLPQPDLDLPDLDDEGDTRMDEGVGSEAMEVDSFLVDELMAASLNQVYTGPDVRTVSKEVDRSFNLLFCGARITCVVPKTAVSETSGEHLEPKLLETAMRLELEELESFRVGKVISEQEAKVFAKRNGRRVLTSRWVNTVKRPGLYRARLVVRDFASFGGSTLNEGIYSPTTTLEGLRVLLALLSQSGSLVSGDVSVAFMHADCARPEVIQMPCNVSLEKGGNVFVRLVKAVNGLRSAPLSWYKEISSFLESEGFTQIIDPTIFRKFVWRKDTRFLSVVLFYVDDILILSQLEGEAERIFDMLAKKYKLKRTGFIEEGCEGEVTFLGRKIFRTKEMAGKNAVMFGLEPAYLWSCCEEFQISKGTLKLPTLEKITKGDKSTPLSPEAHDRYRRVLGKLAWASLTRPDLAFVTGYLGRSQAAPTEASEQAMRAVLRWVLALPPLVQRFPSERYSLKDECDPREVTLFVDASWSLESTSGGIVSWLNCYIKAFSRKQSVTALSSAEAELMSLTEGAKESLYIALLIQHLTEGVEGETGDYGIHALCDSQAAICISNMNSLLRKVRHLELRAQYIQELVSAKCLYPSYLPGRENPSDALTKSPTVEMLMSLCEACGLCVWPNADWKMEARNVSFNNVVDSKEVECFDPGRLSLPVPWLSPARKLAEGKSDFVVLEICCSEDSAIAQACSKVHRLSYFGVTEKLDILSASSKKALKELVKVLSNPNVKMWVHISTPCTAGCGLRHINMRREEYLAKWREQIAAHVETWGVIGRVFRNYLGHERLLFSQEWPEVTDLWYEETYSRVSSKLDLHTGSRVERCNFDGVVKRWYFATNSTAFADELRKYSVCQGGHEHFRTEVQKSGFYPLELGRFLVVAARCCLS